MQTLGRLSSNTSPNISSIVTSSLRILIELIKKNVEVDEGVAYYQGFILSVVAILEDVLSTLERMIFFLKIVVEFLF